LADVRLSQLQIEKAELLFEDCVKQSPDSATALLGLAECKRRQGNSEEANRLLYDALTLDLSPEQQGVALASLGQVALENGKYNRASRLLEEALEKNPNDPAVHLALAAAMLAQGRKEPAAEHRETAKAITERHARVVGLTRQAIQEPDNAKLRCEAGLILLEQGLLTSGAQWLDSAIQVDPNYAPAHDGLAKYFRSVGDHRAAAEQERIAERLHVASSTDTKGSARP
jgi:Tfp pilus assembly protein PilF